jgi:hypothetical protein
MISKDTDKFDTDLDANFTPLAYVEEERIVDTDKAGQMVVLAHGAMEEPGRNAVEFGGVSILHLDPDLFICVKYIPWNKQERLAEVRRQVTYLKENKDHLRPGDIVDHFRDLGYTMPADKNRAREAYYNDQAKENRQQAKETMAKEDDCFTSDGEKIIPLDD